MKIYTFILYYTSLTQFAAFIPITTLVLKTYLPSFESGIILFTVISSKHELNKQLSIKTACVELGAFDQVPSGPQYIGISKKHSLKQKQKTIK